MLYFFFFFVVVVFIVIVVIVAIVVASRLSFGKSAWAQWPTASLKEPRGNYELLNCPRALTSRTAERAKELFAQIVASGLRDFRTVHFVCLPVCLFVCVFGCLFVCLPP